jgi:FkbM family methyltransferase
MPRIIANVQVNTTSGARPVLFQLDPDQYTQRAILGAFQAQQFYEPETSQLLAMLLNPGDTFIDVGGHVGYFSMLAAALVGPTGRVVVFEPERRNYEHILTHMVANDFRNITPFPWAVGGERRVVELYINLDNDGGHALWDPGRHPLCEKSRSSVTKVPTYQTNLDAVFQGAPPGSVKLIKIDVEGNEMQVLGGGRELLRGAKVSAVVAEVNSFGLEQRGASERQMRAFMYELGYVSYLLAQWPPVLLRPDQVYQSQYVYNLLFVSPELQAAVADKWPQAKQ